MIISKFAVRNVPAGDITLLKDKMILFKTIFFNENYCILNKFSLKFVPKDPTDNMSALV